MKDAPAWLNGLHREGGCGFVWELIREDQGSEQTWAANRGIGKSRGISLDSKRSGGWVREANRRQHDVRNRTWRNSFSAMLNTLDDSLERSPASAAPLAGTKKERLSRASYDEGTPAQVVEMARETRDQPESAVRLRPGDEGETKVLSWTRACSRC